MKTILFHAHPDDQLVHGLENALSLARAHSAHLTCLHAAPILNYAVSGIGGATYMIDDAAELMEQRVAYVRAQIETELDDEDVSWDFRHVDMDSTAAVARFGALADLVVTTRRPVSEKGYKDSLYRLGELLHACRTPLFIAGDNRIPIDPTGPAIIAWNGSVESANAVRGARDLLKHAKTVRVVRVDDKGGEFPDTGLLEYLSRHGIHAELDVEPFKKHDIVEVLTSHIEREDAAFVVAGAYGHSRLGEWLFGGVTRSLLMQCRAGLIMAR